MPKIQKVMLYFAFGVGAIAFACGAWLDNPPWAHSLFLVAWSVGAVGIVAPMVFTSKFGVFNKPFRLFGIGFILVTFPSIANHFGASINNQWFWRIGFTLVLVGLLFGILNMSRRHSGS